MIQKMKSNLGCGHDSLIRVLTQHSRLSSIPSTNKRQRRGALLYNILEYYSGCLRKLRGDGHAHYLHGDGFMAVYVSTLTQLCVKTCAFLNLNYNLVKLLKIFIKKKNCSNQQLGRQYQAVRILLLITL